jgi:polyisoprenoid-binding protein YceI
MVARYRFDPPRSRFTIQAFATGFLSAFAHSPIFAVRDFDGGIRFRDGRVEDLELELIIPADALELESRVAPAERRDIESRMRTEVLEPARYPEIRFHSTDVLVTPSSPGRYQLRMGGRLSLHGVTLPHEIDAELLVFSDGLRLRGEDSLRMSQYRIRPVTALGGAIQLKDDMRLEFDISAFSERPSMARAPRLEAVQEAP